MGRVYEPELSKTRIDAETTYRVEKILSKRTKGGRKELLIKFIGYNEPEWIPEENLKKD